MSGDRYSAGHDPVLAKALSRYAFSHAVLQNATTRHLDKEAYAAAHKVHTDAYDGLIDIIDRRVNK